MFDHEEDSLNQLTNIQRAGLNSYVDRPAVHAYEAVGARDRNRTCMAFRPEDFESSVYS